MGAIVQQTFFPVSLQKRFEEMLKSHGPPLRQAVVVSQGYGNVLKRDDISRWSVRNHAIMSVVRLGTLERFSYGSERHSGASLSLNTEVVRLYPTKAVRHVYSGLTPANFDEIA